MNFYNESQSLPLEKVSFSYMGGRYQGRGLLEWDPVEGASLHAFVRRAGSQLPSRIEFGQPRVLGPSDRKTIRMTIQGSRERGRALSVPLVDRMDLVMHEQLSIRISSLILNSRSHAPENSERVGGEAVYGGFKSPRPVFPDPIHTTRKLKGRRHRRGWSRSGLSLGDPVGARVRGELMDDDFFKVRWSLGPRYRQLGRWWKWPIAFGEALSLLLGQEVQLRESRAQNRHRTRRWITRERETTSLNFLRPFPADLLEKPDLRRLTRLLYKDRVEGQVVRRIERQLAEAARQESWAATELLTATILEAALRRLENEPFQPGQPNRFKAKKSLVRFRKRYLSGRWGDRCTEVYKAWRRLRHRNAHPDWMDQARRDHKGNKQAIVDMALLAQFYGAMSLALAGRTDLIPAPAPTVT